MSKRHQSSKTPRIPRAPPKISAVDVNPANRPRAHFDGGLAFAVKETARRRAPTSSSIWAHRIGFAGELATAAYFDVCADWSISEGYIGDDGYDFIHDGDRMEVKTTSKEKPSQWDLAVPIEKVDSADYFVLAQCSRPDELVHLIGWTSREKLKGLGSQFDGKIRVEPTALDIFEPLKLFPDKIRSTQGL